MGDVPPPPSLQKNVPEEYLGNCVNANLQQMLTQHSRISKQYRICKQLNFELNQTAWSDFQDRKQTQIITQNEYRVVQKKKTFLKNSPLLIMWLLMSSSIFFSFQK